MILIIAFIATFLCALSIGFSAGVVKGMSLAAHHRSGRPVSPIPWILCFVGSGILLLTSVGTTIYSMYFLASSVQAEATVTEIVETKDNEGVIHRSPVYSYENASGEDFTDTSSTGDGREYKVGNVIPIRYLKNSPHQSRIDYFSHHWVLPIIMAVLSIALAGLGYGLRWWRNRE